MLHTPAHSFSTSVVRNAHIKAHNRERQFSCPHPACNRTFTRTTNLKNHVRIHTGEKPYSCPHDGCGKAFTEYSSLYKHCIVHTHNRPYKCNQCEKTFRHASSLASHRRVVHKPSERSDSVVVVNLIDGVNNTQDGVNPCPLTLTGTETGSKLNKHTLILYQPSQNNTASGAMASDETCYTCPEVTCDATFISTVALEKHGCAHTAEKSFSCLVDGCNRHFRTSATRRRHMKIHSREKPFSCPVETCQRRFLTASNLNNHLRIHTKEKPYSCSYEGCGSRFAEYSSLYKHRVIHTHQKPYACKVCDKRFRHVSSLAVHRRTVHQNGNKESHNAGDIESHARTDKTGSVPQATLLQRKIEEKQKVKGTATNKSAAPFCTENSTEENMDLMGISARHPKTKKLRTLQTSVHQEAVKFKNNASSSLLAKGKSKFHLTAELLCAESQQSTSSSLGSKEKAVCSKDVSEVHFVHNPNIQRASRRERKTCSKVSLIRRADFSNLVHQRSEKNSEMDTTPRESLQNLSERQFCQSSPAYLYNIAESPSLSVRSAYRGPPHSIAAALDEHSSEKVVFRPSEQPSDTNSLPCEAVLSTGEKQPLGHLVHGSSLSSELRTAEKDVNKPSARDIRKCYTNKPCGTMNLTARTSDGNTGISDLHFGTETCENSLTREQISSPSLTTVNSVIHTTQQQHQQGHTSGECLTSVTPFGTVNDDDCYGNDDTASVQGSANFRLSVNGASHSHITKFVHEMSHECLKDFTVKLLERHLNILQDFLPVK